MIFCVYLLNFDAWFYWVQLLKAPSTVGSERCCPGTDSQCSQGTKVKIGLVLQGLNPPSVRRNAAIFQLSDISVSEFWQFKTFISSEFHVFKIYSFWEKLKKPENSPMTLPGAYLTWVNSLYGRWVQLQHISALARWTEKVGKQKLQSYNQNKIMMCHILMCNKC